MLPVCAVVVLMSVLDHPLGCIAATNEQSTRAALAIRDHVPAYQKYGTRLFTEKTLHDAYDEAVYLVESEYGHEHAELAPELTRLLERHASVDLFLLAHGNNYSDQLELVPSHLRHKLRLVYNTGCAGAGHADRWLQAGATTYLGHEADRSISPLFYLYFLRRWARGESLEAAVRSANERAGQRLSWLGLSEPAYQATATVFGQESLWIGSTPESR